MIFKNFRVPFAWIISVGVVIVASVLVGCGPGADDAGDQPVTVTLSVAGMTCESCEQAIVHTVGEIDGVDMVEAQHDPGTATVLYRPDTVTIEMIVEAIEGLGYTIISEEG